jgi:hypothetical protein
MHSRSTSVESRFETCRDEIADARVVAGTPRPPGFSGRLARRWTDNGCCRA